MKILRYTPAIQAAIKSKTEAKPWLHIIQNSDTYAIFIWDTREVIEEGRVGFVIEGPTVKDNRKPLKGSKLIVPPSKISRTVSAYLNTAYKNHTEDRNKDAVKWLLDSKNANDITQDIANTEWDNKRNEIDRDITFELVLDWQFRNSTARSYKTPKITQDMRKHEYLTDKEYDKLQKQNRA